MELTPNGIPRSLKFALQEYDLEKLNLDEHAFTIIERTLAYGNRAELRWLFAKFGSARLAAWVRESGWRILPRRRCGFWTSYFGLGNLPKRRGIWPY
jgi:hypothetical protein